MDEFPSNSRNRSSQPEKATPPEEEVKKLNRVVTGKVIKRKKPLGRRMIDTFFAGDGVLGYLGKEVLLPALQNLITDFVTQGVNRAVYGDAAPPRSSVRGGSVGRTHISYDRYNSANRPAVREVSPTTRRLVTQPSSVDIGEVILGSKIEAQVVVDKLYETVEEYGCATVANLNELIGQTSVYTDHKYGWTDLTTMTVKRIREGFLLQLPDPEDLK